MNKKEIIILAAIGAGVYILSQVKAMKTYIAPQYAKTAAQKAAQKAAAQKKIRQEAAQKIAQKIAQKVAQMDISEMPVQLLRYLIAHAAAQEKTGKEMVALKAEVARRVAAWKVAQKAAPKRIGQPITRTAYIAAAQKAAAQKKIRQEAAQKIGKIIGKKVAQKVVPGVLEETGGRTGMALYIYLKKKAAAMRAAVTQAVNAARTGSKIILPSSKWAGGRTGMALAIFLKKRAIALEQAAEQAKAAITRPTSKLFPGAERSRIIPYSESSRHSYYGPKSHKLQNEGYGKNKAKRDRKQALEFRLQELRNMFPSSNL